MTPPHTPFLDDVALRARDAHSRVAPELEAIPASELLVANLHIPTTVAKTLPRMDTIRTLRPRIVDELPRFDLRRFDRLEDYLLAMAYAHHAFRSAGAPRVVWTEQHDYARQLRDRLVHDANTLVARGAIDPSILSSLSGLARFQNVADDLLALDAAFRREWPVVVRGTNIVAADLDRARALADAMVEALRRRDEAPARLAAASLDRIRAFTLFVTTYDQARRAASHLRWSEGDADTIVPWLFPSRSKPKGLAGVVQREVP